MSHSLVIDTPSPLAPDASVQRPELEASLAAMLSAAGAGCVPCAMLYIDLDHFTLVNNACGRAAGDELLREIEGMLLRSVRCGDRVVRIGGDEFALLLDDCSASDALRRAEELCDRFDRHRFRMVERELRVSLSIGVVVVDARWTDAACVIRAADAACFAAKDRGRNRVHFWSDSDRALQVQLGEAQWADQLEAALAADRFVLYAQRIEKLNAPSRAPHAEVLIRMIGTDGEVIPPSAFLPAAERFHLAGRVDRWVLERVLAWLQDPHAAGTPQSLSANISGQSVADLGFHAWAVGRLRRAGPAVCARLTLEITETAAVGRLAEASAFVAQVRALGVRVALDDFGAGASSFAYLRRLNVDYLKIDGQFVQHLLDDPLHAAVVRCFIEVAGVLGLETVAEYVDHPAVLERLAELGVDHVQGYLLHRPEPLDRLRDQPA